MKPIYPFKSETERALYRLGVNGTFLQILRDELKKQGLEIGREDAVQFQHRILSIVSSMKETPRAKIDQVAKEIEDTGSGILDLVDLATGGGRVELMEGPSCLTQKREKRQKPVHAQNTHTVKKSLAEVKWIYRRKDGRPLGRLQKEGNKVALYGFGKGVLGWYLPKAGPPHGYTIDKFGKIVGFGNLLGTLLNEGH